MALFLLDDGMVLGAFCLIFDVVCNCSGGWVLVVVVVWLVVLRLGLMYGYMAYISSGRHLFVSLIRYSVSYPVTHLQPFGIWHSLLSH